MKTNNTTTMALVNETLTKDEVMSLLNETLDRKKDINDYLSILKGEFTAWDNTVHSGYIVSHINNNHVDYYFMEVTLEEVVNPNGTCHLWEPTFHMLMPITENYKRKPMLPETGNAKDLCSYIISNAHRDKWDYIYVPMTKEEIEKGKKRDYWWYTHHTTKTVSLTYNDIYGYWSTPLTEEEQVQRKTTLKAKENALIYIFSKEELPPAEDDVWYSILSMGYGTQGYDFECKVVEILKKRGFSVRIDGERDSFGWVTRGIWVDDKMMCIY